MSAGPTPFTFTNRKPKGIPGGGEFAASSRAESEVELTDSEAGIEVGEWAESESTRVRLVPEDESPTQGKESLVLDVQVRDDHPDAGEPVDDSPGWTRPRSAPAQRPRVPPSAAASPQGRGRFSAFALRRFDSALTDIGLAWGELGEAFDMSVPQIR